MPSLGGEPPTGLEGTTDEQEFEPILESGEREQDGGKGRNGRFVGEGIGDAREVRREIVQIHDPGVNKAVFLG